jgi:hypothetical protein
MSIPQNVKDMIDKYTDNGKDDLYSYYNMLLIHKDTNDDIITKFWENNTTEIKDKIRTVTIDTQEDDLTSLPISTTGVKQLIDKLLELGFLPTQIEYQELYNKFYGKPGGKNEKDQTHKNPYKFNGFVLAVFLANLIKSITFTKSVSSSAAAVARAAPASSSKPDLTGIPQTYFIWLGPIDKISWILKAHSITSEGNPYCPSSKRTHLRSVNDQVLNNQNKSVLTYKSQKTEDLTSKETGMVKQIEQYIFIVFKITIYSARHLYIYC